jgi:hypothetical protein
MLQDAILIEMTQNMIQSIGVCSHDSSTFTNFTVHIINFVDFFNFSINIDLSIFNTNFHIYMDR